MRIRLISCVLWAVLLASAPCLAQVDTFGEAQETFSAFAGAQFYSRTLKGETEESVRQWVFPLFATSLITEGLRIRVYQTVSTAELVGGPGLSGLENTKVRGAFSFFGNAVMIYAGLSLPIAEYEPEVETAHLSNILYSEVLQFGVSRIAEGFDMDIGFIFVQPFGRLSWGIGAGYVLRGSYDRLSQMGEPVSYNPGDAFSITTGLQFHGGPVSLSGRVLYLHYGDDTMGKDSAFKNGDELSFIAVAVLRFEPLTLTLFSVDTVKGETDTLQERVAVNNLFDNRLNGGISLGYPLLSETLILKAQLGTKWLFSDGDVNAKVISAGGGFRLVITDNLSLDVMSSLMGGDMDAGETEISGFNLGLTLNCGF